MIARERRLSALEAKAPDAVLPWVRFPPWRFGEPRPVPPPGCNYILRRFVSPDHPPEWRNMTGDAA